MYEHVSLSLVSVQRDEHEVDELDEKEGNDDTTHAVDPNVAPQNRRRAWRRGIARHEVQRDNATITKALKMTADSTALWDCAGA